MRNLFNKMYLEHENTRRGKTDLPQVPLNFLTWFSHVDKAWNPLLTDNFKNLLNMNLLSYLLPSEEHYHLHLTSEKNCYNSTHFGGINQSSSSGFHLLKSLEFNRTGIMQLENFADKKNSHICHTCPILQLLQSSFKRTLVSDYFKSSMKDNRTLDCSSIMQIISSSDSTLHPEFSCIAVPFSTPSATSNIDITSNMTLKLIPSKTNSEQQRIEKYKPQISISLDSKPVMSSRSDNTNVSVSSCAFVAVSRLRKGCNNTMDVMNQELISRKNQKMNKLSKKRRKRQKKRDTKGSDMFDSRPINKENISSLVVTQDDSDVVEMNPESLNFHDDTCENAKTLNDLTIHIKTEHSPIQKDQCLHSSVAFIFEQVLDSETDSEWDCDEDNSISSTELDFEFPDMMTNIASITIGGAPIGPSSFHIGATNPSTSSCHISVIEISEMSAELCKVNERWITMTSDIDDSEKQPTKVSFAQEENLATVFPVDIYDRKGEWEIYAQERFRFKRRIEGLENILAPCLMPLHREKILNMRNAVDTL